MTAVKRASVLLCGVAWLGGMATSSWPCPSDAREGAGMAPAEKPGDELVQMIVGLLGDKDPEMRAVGLQQVREAAKGEAATRQFAGLLAKLAPDAQAALLDALGDRGDKAARPSVLEMLKSREEPVRAAALRALGALGDADDVPLLARSLASPAAPEKAAARASLTRLRGQAAGAAIVEESKQAKPAVRSELLGVLAARGATESVPMLLEAAQDPDAGVRLAALGALRVLAVADLQSVPGRTAAIVKLLKAAREGPEQSRAEQVLLAVAGRGREDCVDAILAGMAGADPQATVSLLRALGKAGGRRALDAIVAAAKDQRAAIRAEAVRLLASWPDAAAVPHLLTIARQAEPLAQQAVAVQGLVRLASPLKDRPADVALLGEAMKLARRAEEKRMVLGVLGGVATPEALALVLPAMDDPALTDEACLAAVLIAEKPGGLDQARRRTVLKQAVARAKEPAVRQRAQKALESLGPP